MEKTFQNSEVFLQTLRPLTMSIANRNNLSNRICAVVKLRLLFDYFGNNEFSLARKNQHKDNFCFSSGQMSRDLVNLKPR